MVGRGWLGAACLSLLAMSWAASCGGDDGHVPLFEIAVTCPERLIGQQALPVVRADRHVGVELLVARWAEGHRRQIYQLADEGRWP